MLYHLTKRLIMTDLSQHIFFRDTILSKLHDTFSSISNIFTYFFVAYTRLHHLPPCFFRILSIR